MANPQAAELEVEAAETTDPSAEERAAELPEARALQSEKRRLRNNILRRGAISALSGVVAVTFASKLSTPEDHMPEAIGITVRDRIDNNSDLLTEFGEADTYWNIGIVKDNAIETADRLTSNDNAAKYIAATSFAGLSIVFGAYAVGDFRRRRRTSQELKAITTPVGEAAAEPPAGDAAPEPSE